uniref:Mucin 1, cell surface associated n=1 Tax=Oryctolagus cuniculus TaxID=9986 RepID=A0A5F9DGD3_RABIT
MPVGTLSTPSSVPSHTGTPTTLPSPSHSTGSPVTTSTQSTAPQVSAGCFPSGTRRCAGPLPFSVVLAEDMGLSPLGHCPDHGSFLSVRDVLSPSSAQSGVPGWGIALLVLVCVLLALAIIYFIALAVCQCRRKNCGQLDLFPTRDTYHPMSEYPTYHTHGRYVPPGSTRRSPYEEESAGNGGSGLSYTSPPVAATSAHLAGTCTFTKGQPGAGSLS